MTLASVIERSRREKESWRYTDLEKILKSTVTLNPAANSADWTKIVATLNLKDDAAHRLVFVNGVLAYPLCHINAPSSASFRRKPESSDRENNAHNFWHGILSSDAPHSYMLSFADQTCLVTTPIELVFITDGTAAETATNLTISIGASASLTITEHHIAASVATTAQIIESDIRLGTQAKLEHNKILHDNRQAAHLARSGIYVGEGAYYRNFVLIKDTRLVRNEIHVTLGERLAQCALNGAMLLRDREHADTFTRITHAAPHGTSRQLYKSIVTDRAKGAFQGKITVAENAQKTDGRQLSRALLLSDQAEMHAKPELQIYADDVSCSHGSTVGDIDANALFYLRTRGLDPATARALLLRAFIDEVINEAHEAGEHSQNIHAAAENWLNDDNLESKNAD